MTIFLQQKIRSETKRYRSISSGSQNTWIIIPQVFKTTRPICSAKKVLFVGKNYMSSINFWKHSAEYIANILLDESLVLLIETNEFRFP